MTRSRLGASALALGALLGCRASAPAPAPHFDPVDRFTCCNLHHDGDEISDANYWVGAKVPVGTPVHIESATAHTVTFVAGGEKLTLKHEYGTKEETFEAYVAKIFVAYDPHRRIGEFPDEVQSAIEKGKVERGMTREQVLLSLGYPPAHATDFLKELEWTYWYNHWSTYRVLFDERGKVTGVVGRPAPTAEVTIEHSDPVPPQPAKKKKSKQSR